MKRWLSMIVAVGLILYSSGFVFAQASKPPAKTPELLSLGKKVYDQNCASCHGPTGNGKTPLGLALKPPPRDFNIPFNQWPHAKGNLRKVYDLISRGIPNTAMIKWDQLPEKERWALTYYVVEFSTPKPPPKKKK
ncbi:MAG: cytochrome c [Deltaproteobacteria bacterium]|nr:cytochrome c [Deltaproteobacteria bacterium]